MANIIVIGAGFGGLSSAAYLAKSGHKVTVIEKNAMPGGRAQVFTDKGFVFDAGPSWYMMPDVFEEFFAHFGKKPTDYFALKKLNPAYRVVTQSASHDIASYPAVLDLVESLDSTAVPEFKKFYQQMNRNYKRVRNGILDLPMLTVRDALRPEVLRFLASKDMFRSYAKRIEQITSNPDLQHILQFMSVFMGGSPTDIPAIYALLAYVDMGLGVYYPQGGFGAVARGFEALCKELGVTFHYDESVERIASSSTHVQEVITNKGAYPTDCIISNADYHYVETEILTPAQQSYSESYWQKSAISPSGLVMLIGLNKRVKHLLHHTLFFDTDWDKHFALLKAGKWSDTPLFYLSTPSLSDDSVAPKGCENLFVLAPQAAGCKPTASQLKHTEQNILQRLTNQVGFVLKPHIVTQQSLTMDYFSERFHAYKGNAFGMSHTLKQSATFRPRMQSKKLRNLYYVGQYTNPGTGVPMVVLSGKVVANLVQSKL